MEASKLIAKNLLNNRVCNNCRHHISEVQRTTYLSGKEGEIKIDECILNKELDLYDITDKYTCESWQDVISDKNYFSTTQQIQNPVQGQIAIDTKNNELLIYDGFEWKELS